MLINGRTPEEIKAALKRCGRERCKSDKADDCPYYIDCLVGATRMKLMKNALALVERLESERDAALAQVPKWISVKDKKPKEFVSVQVYMTDAGDFPPVREGYYVDEDRFYIPALHEFHPVSHWKPFNEPPEE